MKQPIFGAIVLAAGAGARFHTAKPDVLFHGTPLWRYPYQAAVSVVGAEHTVVVGKDVPGGTTRSGSVLRGLDALPADTGRVVILEAARPLVTREQIVRLLDDPAPSVSYARALVDAVAYRNGDPIDRDTLYALSAPQAFDLRLLSEAYHSGRFDDVADETRVMLEYHGIKPQFVEGGSNLFKVTYPEDLAILEAIYQSRK